MKTTFLRLVAAVTLASTTVSCTTAYDAYGNPRPVVDPAAAVVGAAAVGLLAYGLANSNDHHHRSSCDNRYYRSSHYHQPSYGYSRYNRGYCRY